MRVVAYPAIDPPISLRSNFCSASYDVLNGRSTLANALIGSTLTVAIHDGTPSYAMTISNDTGLPTGGFYYDLWTKLSEKGKFNIQYVLVKNCMDTKGTKECLKYYLPKVDIYGNNYYSKTTDRLIDRIGFTRELVDASLVLIVLPPTLSGTNDYDIWLFVYPFNIPVWICLGAVVLYNAICHFILECEQAVVDGEEDDDLEEEEEENRNNDIYTMRKNPLMEEEGKKEEGSVHHEKRSLRHYFKEFFYLSVGTFTGGKL